MAGRKDFWIGKGPVLLGAALCLALVAAGLIWRQVLTGTVRAVDLSQLAPGSRMPTLHHPFIEFLKLLAAFLVGELITEVHRRSHRGRPLAVAIEQAQVLLSVAGALMMIIIGDSLARAFGIAGAASIIRFRTPVDDPRDTMILFLSLGLGMACGLGAFAIAGLGTAFLCAVLVWLHRSALETPRVMALTLTAATADFPSEHVEDVLIRHGVQFETREVAQGAETQVRYRVTFDRNLALERLSEELRDDGRGAITSVIWQKGKERREKLAAAAETDKDDDDD
ncbi:MAG: DUF4956 domain-containing protein [Acidobacteriota bacterium]